MSTINLYRLTINHGIALTTPMKQSIILRMDMENSRYHWSLIWLQMPRKIVIVDEIPKNESGKIIKNNRQIQK